MGTPRRLLAAATIGGVLYALGGNDGTRALASCERYDTAGGTWEEVRGMTERRQGCAAVCAGTRLLVLGGWDGLSVGRHASGESYDPSVDSWSPTPSLARARFGLVAAVV